MVRWTILGILGSLVLAGCGDATRVERREVVGPAAAPAAAPAAKPEEQPTSPAAKPTPGEAPPHGMQASATPKADPGGAEVALGKIHLTGAKVWVRKAPRSEFIQAEFALPRAEGDAVDGRLTVSTAGGTVDDNIARWLSQFAGKPARESTEKLDVAGQQVTVVDFSGTYNDQRGPFAPAVECPDYRMLGAIFDVDGRLHFIKAYGPSKTMAARADEFRAFVRSLKKD